uniref:Uncharacterized protein n=1 Tax=Oryza sativa subsp. japonica TaxID=39947 RepID=Q5Z578_ORYSJ|nr:hypothetical protein [Oryza sativa Japonica Group]BAD69403.1 hypothetical protein [Oryza sativa Japonica Group]
MACSEVEYYWWWHWSHGSRMPNKPISTNSRSDTTLPVSYHCRTPALSSHRIPIVSLSASASPPRRRRLSLRVDAASVLHRAAATASALHCACAGAASALHRTSTASVLHRAVAATSTSALPPASLPPPRRHLQRKYFCDLDDLVIFGCGSDLNPVHLVVFL